MKNLGKLIFAFILIYYGYGYAEEIFGSKTVCGDLSCDNVSCPSGYAIWIQEEGKFLPCDDWDQYFNIGNKSVLK